MPKKLLNFALVLGLLAGFLGACEQQGTEPAGDVSPSPELSPEESPTPESSPTTSPSP